MTKIWNGKKFKTGLSGTNRRKFLKLAGSAGLGAFTGISSASPGPEHVCCANTWPKTYDFWFSAPYDLNSNSTTETQASTHLNLIDSTYEAGRWRYYFRTETNIGQVYKLEDNPNAVGYNINGKHRLHVKETEGADELSTMHGSEERDFGVTGANGDTPLWQDVVYDVGKSLVSGWSNTISDIITAADIISKYTSPDPDGVNSQGLFYEWDVTGKGKVGNYLHWETNYPPNDNYTHKINFLSQMTGIPDETYTNTSNYGAEWSVDLGSLTAPSRMTTKEKEKYGIEKIHPESITSHSSSTESNDGPIYRAKNPPITAEVKSKQ